MSDYLGNDRARPGSYLGAPPQAGGFGRRVTPSPAAPAAPAPVVAPRPADSATLSPLAQQVIEAHRAHQNGTADIEFIIGGNDIQYVEIILERGAAVVAESGSMIWKDDQVDFTLVLGDGSNDKAWIGSKIVSAGSNLISGEDLYFAQFQHNGSREKARVALGGKTPGTIVPIRLADVGGALICHRTSFLAGAKGVDVAASVQRNLMSGLFGDEGLITQTLTGTGWVFLHVGGALIERELERGQMIQVDSGCVVAHESSVNLSVGITGGFKASLAGGEGPLLATVSGPGKVWIQTLPFQRVADAIMQTARPTVGSVIRDGVGEGISSGIGHAVKDGGVELLKRMF